MLETFILTLLLLIFAGNLSWIVNTIPFYKLNVCLWKRQGNTRRFIYQLLKVANFM